MTDTTLACASAEWTHEAETFIDVENDDDHEEWEGKFDPDEEWFEDEKDAQGVVARDDASVCSVGSTAASMGWEPWQASRGPPWWEEMERTKWSSAGWSQLRDTELYPEIYHTWTDSNKYEDKEASANWLEASAATWQPALRTEEKEAVCDFSSPPKPTVRNLEKELVAAFEEIEKSLKDTKDDAVLEQLQQILDGTIRFPTSGAIAQKFRRLANATEELQKLKQDKSETGKDLRSRQLTHPPSQPATQPAQPAYQHF